MKLRSTRCILKLQTKGRLSNQAWGRPNTATGGGMREHSKRSTRSPRVTNFGIRRVEWRRQSHRSISLSPGATSIKAIIFMKWSIPCCSCEPFSSSPVHKLWAGRLTPQYPEFGMAHHGLSEAYISGMNIKEKSWKQAGRSTSGIPPRISIPRYPKKFNRPNQIRIVRIVRNVGEVIIM
ncbi:hypothetical protein BGX38DRAFT_477531 [Terfezia claveryi]|nr:hypothetical protein BGX38DRAFT_477531 [Terfezia claveryi]